MKILVIKTGGTIDSAYNDIDKQINVTQRDGSAVAEKYKSEHNDCSFEVINPLNILSENISKEDFYTLAKVMYNTDRDAYDGVIVTCGSDALSYISAFIGLLFWSEKPIMIVCANKIEQNGKSNGYINFCAAVELIKLKLGGVFVPYQNSDETIYVHCATEILPANFNDDFYSRTGAYAVFDKKSDFYEKFCGKNTIDKFFENDRIFVGDKICKKTTVWKLRIKNTLIRQKIKNGVFDRQNAPYFDKTPVVINAYPMLDYSKIKTEGVFAFLHTLYHSSTLDSIKAVDFIQRIGDVPFFISPLKKGNALYKSTQDVLKSGALALYEISNECAYIKLCLALNQQKYSIVEFMEE